MSRLQFIVLGLLFATLARIAFEFQMTTDDLIFWLGILPASVAIGVLTRIYVP